MLSRAYPTSQQQDTLPNSRGDFLLPRSSSYRCGSLPAGIPAYVCAAWQAALSTCKRGRALLTGGRTLWVSGPSYPSRVAVLLPLLAPARRRLLFRPTRLTGPPLCLVFGKGRSSRFRLRGGGGPPLARGSHPSIRFAWPGRLPIVLSIRVAATSPWSLPTFGGWFAILGV